MNEIDHKFAFLDEASMRFLRSVKTQFGPLTAVETMNALQPILGREWVGRIMFHMMADNHMRIERFKISCPPNYQKIYTIKQIRSMTGLGLTESKRLVEQAEATPQTIEVPLQNYNGEPILDSDISIFFEALKSFGVKVVL